MSAIAATAESASGPGTPPVGWRAAGRPALTGADYIAPDGALNLRDADAATYEDPSPGGLYTHPAWLRAYGAGALLIVEGQAPARAAPRLVFARQGGGLVHQGRLFRVEAGLVAALADRLMAQTKVPFVVFEDVDVVGTIPPGRLVFHYQNDWRLPLGEAAVRMSKQLVGNTRRKARGLRRDHPDTDIRFAAAPGRDVLERIAAFGRIRIEGQGRRYGIDPDEIARLTRVSAEIGHGTVVRDGDAIRAADLICIAGGHAHFLTHGYDPAFPRSSLGMICLINSIESCAARGLTDFHLLWGDLPYKQQLGAERVPLRTVVARRSALAFAHPGHLAALWRFGAADLKRRLRPAVTWLRDRAAARRSPAG